jgi:hypothetical protein
MGAAIADWQLAISDCCRDLVDWQSAIEMGNVGTHPLPRTVLTSMPPRRS